MGCFSIVAATGYGLIKFWRPRAYTYRHWCKALHYNAFSHSRVGTYFGTSTRFRTADLRSVNALLYPWAIEAYFYSCVLNILLRYSRPINPASISRSAVTDGPLLDKIFGAYPFFNSLERADAIKIISNLLPIISAAFCDVTLAIYSLNVKLAALPCSIP